MLRPVGLAAIVVVSLTATGGHPAPALHGKGLDVTIALVVFGVALARSIGGEFTERSLSLQGAVIFVMGVAAVALAALQPHGTTELAGGAAVWMAVARLPATLGPALGGIIGGALVASAALSGNSTASVLATALLYALIGLIAYFLRQARTSQDRTELLLAQLEDAREEQVAAAAVAERGRIASELHDVLAHSLSGAAIQLQGARMLAEREGASADVRTAIDRSSELVREGLVNARQAVGALRGDQVPGVTQLEALVETYRADMNVNVTLEIEGAPRPLTVDASLALYRAAQEALTNVARYAPGAAATVTLSYGDGRTTLSVENGAAQASGGLVGVGGGRGLAGLRERVEGSGGTVEAGQMGDGWRVVADVPS